ncbi:MAG: hypothetical protein WD749_09520 [Phycisphaerales bacterium]
MRRVRDILGRAGLAGTQAGRLFPSFTLIETMVAVGALAFVAVGIAVIFEATGRTVSTGKRVSAFNTYAAAIEQRIGADIRAMTREGFLVIRNEYADADNDGQFFPSTTANNSDWVSLYVGDTRRRLRRTDELMFFAKGQYVSLREMLVPGVVARSEAARVYYGHGRRRAVNASTAGEYLRPTLDDDNDHAITILGGPDPANPNRYASSWTLLRHVTVLAPPQATTRTIASSFYNNKPDSDIQVALQPAAASVFRALMGQLPGTAPPLATLVRPSTPPNTPRFGSGIVDIATTDLREVRAVVLTADVFPGPGVDPTSFFDPAANNRPDGRNAGVDGQFRPMSEDPDVLWRMLSWMDDALPTRSHPTSATQPRMRIRYEPAAPDFAGVLQDGSLSQQQREWRRADQVMLSSSNFLPRCTEFIVEWSFGSAYPWDPAAAGWVTGLEGQLIWHGLRREANMGGQRDVELAAPYDSDAPAWLVQRQTTEVPLRNGQRLNWRTSTELIHGKLPGIVDTEPLTSYFGYVDPYFDPERDATGGPGLNGPGDAAVATVACPWPKFIRITLSVADPADPSVERTFQFVFDVPQDGAQ